MDNFMIKYNEIIRIALLYGAETVESAVSALTYKRRDCRLSGIGSACRPSPSTFWYQRGSRVQFKHKQATAHQGSMESESNKLLDVKKQHHGREFHSSVLQATAHQGVPTTGLAGQSKVRRCRGWRREISIFTILQRNGWGWRDRKYYEYSHPHVESTAAK